MCASSATRTPSPRTPSTWCVKPFASSFLSFERLLFVRPSSTSVLIVCVCVCVCVFLCVCVCVFVCASCFAVIIGLVHAEHGAERGGRDPRLPAVARHLSDRRQRRTLGAGSCFDITHQTIEADKEHWRCERDVTVRGSALSSYVTDDDHGQLHAATADRAGARHARALREVRVHPEQQRHQQRQRPAELERAAACPDGYHAGACAEDYVPSGQSVLV
jgi:hypothetical protein